MAPRLYLWKHAIDPRQSLDTFLALWKQPRLAQMVQEAVGNAISLCGEWADYDQPRWMK